MPSNPVYTPSFSGKDAGEYFVASFKANNTIQQIKMYENVEYKQVLRKLTETGFGFATPTCSFTDAGTININERVLTLSKFQVHRTLCIDQFNDSADAKFAQNGQLSQNTIDAMMNLMLGEIADRNETLIWQGIASGSSGTQYDGFETLFDADASVIQVGTPVAITDSNVLSEMKRVIDLMPFAVKSASEKPKLYVSSNVAEAFRYKQASLGNGNFYFSGDAIRMSWLGTYEIVECGGMSANTMAFAQPSNLAFGTNTMSDWNTLKMLPMLEVTGDNQVRFVSQFWAGAQHVKGDEVVFYH